MPDVRIRPATADDKPAIAAIHAASWKTAYRGDLPDAFLDTEVDAAMAAAWAETDWTDGDVVLLAEDPEPFAFIAIWCGPDHPAPYIDNLHTLPDRRSQGIGGRLMAAARDLLANGRNGAYLWVLSSNSRATDFYLRLGGVTGPSEVHDIFGHDVEVTKISWTDLTPLAQR